MLNIIKMDIYRLFKTKVLYIIGVVFVVCTFLFTHFLRELGDLDTSLKVYIEDVMDFDMVVFSVIIAIASVLFVTAEINSGYIKNFGGQVSARICLVLSKAVTLFIYTTIMFTIFIVIQGAANKIFFGYAELRGGRKEFAVYTIVQIILYYALALLCMMTVLLLKRNGIAMTIAVVLGLRMTENFYEGINILFHRIPNFDISNYLLIGNMNAFLYGYSSFTACRAVVVGIVFAIVSIFISWLSLKKRDIV